MVDDAIASVGRWLLRLAGETTVTLQTKVKVIERSLALPWKTKTPLLPPAKTTTAEDWVREAIRKGITSYRKIRKWIIEQRGIGVSFSTISKVLQKHQKLT
jgi:hypothetical protein